MIKGVFVVEQIGTWNAIYPLLRDSFADSFVMVYPEIYSSLEKILTNEFKQRFIVLENESRFLQFDFSNYDFAFFGTLSYRQAEHAFLINQAKRFGLRTYVYIDNWSFIEERFAVELAADMVFTIDRAMQDEVHLYSPQLKCTEVGLSDGLLLLEKKGFDDGVTLDAKSKFNGGEILFASEPSPTPEIRNRFVEKYGFDDVLSFELFLKSLSAFRNSEHFAALAKPVRIKFRAHPRELDSRRQLFMQMAAQAGWPMEWDLRDRKQAIQEAELICGMSSMFLVEGSAIGKNVMAFHPNKKCRVYATDQRQNIKTVSSVAEGQEAFAMLDWPWKGTKISVGIFAEVICQTIGAGVSHSTSGGSNQSFGDRNA